jgi:hypothetical protein
MIMRARLPSRASAAVCVLLLGACNASEPPTPSAPVADLAALAPGWNAIAGTGESICSDGSPYRFFVRPGDPRKLLVYFQGGGACWSHRTCSPERQPSYKVNVAEDDPARYAGIFDFDNPANPFREHSMVFAPYCSADVFLGDAVVEYAPEPDADTEAPPITIHHKGLANAASVLAWTFEHFFGPEEIFVAGSSAGSIPSPYYAMKLADAYPEARLAQLGDGSGGYRRDAASAAPQESWGTVAALAEEPAFADLTAANFSYERLYISAAETHPQARFAQLDTAEDETQRRFLTMGGSTAASLLPLLKANQAEIRAAVPNFASFIAGGDLHVLLPRPDFYSYHVGGQSVRDWVGALARGGRVMDVSCLACTEPETLNAAE